ncbi:MAG: hypothetical protein FJ050_03335 [Cyanobacteria bacterium M_surface_7_m2_040]|nr:hypothetical protein [Cyanobacteria bacterium M_surface_9_m1_291]MBM5827079.1 hypothetical protein [Cyanobacteria bacterium M_surface_7_m2_040]
MAHCRAFLPVDLAAQELTALLTDLVGELGLQVEDPDRNHPWLIATDRPRRGLQAKDHVVVLCDWSNLRNTGEMAIETRSGESMAHRDTRAESLLQQLCSGLRQLHQGS